MSTSYTSEKLSLNSAEIFKESFANISESCPIQYIFIGKHTPYSNELSPNPIVETISTEKEVWDNMFAAKRLTANDVELVIPRVNWTANTNYLQYDDTLPLIDLITANTSLNLKPFYVLTTDRNVYKCLSNNASANSTVEPTGDYTTSNGVIATADGYIWKYMYNVRPANKFLTTEWIPIPRRNSAASTLTDYNLDPTGVVEGELSTVVVTSGGINYYHSIVTVSSFTTGCTVLTLANTTNISSNMSVSGTGIATGSFISTVDTPNNRITLSSSATANGGGSGNNLTIVTRVYFEGDGTGAAGTASLANDSISKVTLSTIGIGYEYANVFIFGSGTGAIGRCIIAPKYGHAFNPVKDLISKSVLVTSKIGDLDSTENGLISTDTSFRQFGLLRNPHKYNEVSRANNSTANAVISQARTLTLVPGSQYTLDEYVFQGNSANNATAYGYVYSQTPTQVKITRVKGTFSIGVALTGLNSGVSRTVVAQQDPEFEPYSGDILYVENATKTDREDGQAENIKFVIQF
jgi:hypothetical protein